MAYLTILQYFIYIPYAGLWVGTVPVEGASVLCAKYIANK
jgi:hypothetical protein